MIQKKYLSILAISFLLVATSCSRNTAVEPPRKDTSGKQWADMTNVNVDDTDKNISSKPSSNLREEIIPRPPFPATEYNRLANKGNSTVRGVIYLDDGYGKKIYGQNTRLYLNPVTSYSRQWYNQSYVKGYKLTKADSRLYNYMKFTTSDGNGNFAFFGIPSGSYYVIGSVAYNGQKIRIADQIYVGNKSTITTTLSRSAE
ncbi:MAG: carboxypeptidase regulatory-like domain-containing protein [Campylobacterales bacterium]|nr:carboxypeptidase regulatory-like domain-containing protein [Campylobacterales bacterium]